MFLLVPGARLGESPAAYTDGGADPNKIPVDKWSQQVYYCGGYCCAVLQYVTILVLLSVLVCRGLELESSKNSIKNVYYCPKEGQLLL